MSNNRITPFVKRMRTNGGTIYTFSSAVEDIGLNINERNNVVKISHFALLDIPPINYPPNNDVVVNRFNAYNGIAGSFEYNYPSNPSIKDGRVLIAESFQNYALNLESNFLNQSTYNATLTRTVTERVFWKWLKETGAIRWDKDVSANNVQYWSEELDADGSLGYNTVVKYIGQVSAGNVRTDSFGTYNETYILVPTSHGQTDAYFQIIEDDNYHHNMEIGDLGEKILGRETYTLPQPDGLSYNAYYDFVDSSTGTPVGGGFTMDYSLGSYTPGWWYTAQGREPVSNDNAYLTDSSSYLTSGIYNTDLRYSGLTDIALRRSNVDCLSLVFDLDKLKGIYGDSALTYDKMAIQDQVNDAFNFNAVLIYYTVYNSTMDEVLGRNLLGVLFIDAPSGNSSTIGTTGIIIPALEKIASGPGGFGTSYSLRLNIKTDNMVDDTTATIVDEATSDQIYAEDWSEAFSNLSTAVNILTRNNSTINYLSGQYIEVQETQTQILNDLQALQWQVNDIGRDITGTANTLALFADGDDPLVDSSVYMRFGNVGVHINEPVYPFQVAGTTKVDEIIIENAIRDTSNNILLGYGSPLQLGSSTNYREVDIYSGMLTSAIHVDTSNNVSFRKDVSIKGSLVIDGSALIKGNVQIDGSIINSAYPDFNFSKTYLAVPENLGAQFTWDGNYLGVNSSAVSADGSEGSIQFASAAGLMDSDVNLHWDSAAGRLGLWNPAPNYTLDVSGVINAYSILQNGVPITTTPGGSTTQIQYNNAGAFGGSSSLTWSASKLSVIGDVSITGNIDANLPAASKTNIVYFDTATKRLSYGAPGASGVTSVSAGNGMNFTTITGTGSVTMGTPATLTLSTTNGVTSTSHTHALSISAFTSGAAGLATASGGGTTNFLRADGSWTAPPGGSGTVTSVGGTGTVNGVTLSGTVTSTGNLTLGGTLAIDNGDWSGTDLAVSNGGTGLSTVAANSILTGNGTSALTAESNLTFDGTTLSVTGGISATSAISLGNSGIIFTSQTGTGLSYLATGQIDVNLSGTNEFRFATGGAFHADDNIVAYSSTVPSDIRLKENIKLLNSSLEKVLLLDGIEYDRKKNKKHHIGFIAQEVEKIIPEIIEETELLGEEGKYKTIRYTEMIPYLVEAIKEQQKMIEDLKTEVINLKK